MKIADISLKKIKSGVFADELPELYELKNIVENSRTFHRNNCTFDHTLRVWKILEDYLKKTNEEIILYLNEKVGTHTRKQLLFIGALLHDIGKPETITIENGYTKCPRHEIVGAEKAKKILNRLDLSAKEKQIVIRLVQNHMLTLPCVVPNNPNVEEDVEKIRKDHPDIFIEIIMLSMADTLGTQLNEGNPKEFKFRINYYQRILDEF